MSFKAQGISQTISAQYHKGDFHFVIGVLQLNSGNACIISSIVASGYCFTVANRSGMVSSFHWNSGKLVCISSTVAFGYCFTVANRSFIAEVCACGCWICGCGAGWFACWMSWAMPCFACSGKLLTCVCGCHDNNGFVIPLIQVLKSAVGVDVLIQSILL